MRPEAVFQRHAHGMDDNASNEQRHGIGVKPAWKHERQASAEDDASQTGYELSALSGC
jgi:hypothetical protein